MMPEPVIEHAPAKVNLTLHVLGRRADGYHLLESLVVFAGVGDVVSAAPAAALSCHVAGPHAGALETVPDADNLVLRAARALDPEGARGARIELEKNLPVAAGIGGGSADCAAALRALSRLWGLDLPPARLRALGLALGADVPVCLGAPAPAVMSGIGEVLSPAPKLPPVWLVLVNPGVPVATGAVFKALNAGPARAGGGTFWPGGFADARALARFLATCRNDLEGQARRMVPEVDGVLRVLKATQGCLLARMSGSGATCFGLYADEGAARAAAAAVERPDWWVAPAPVLG